MRNRSLVLQIAILAFCAVVLVQQLFYFPLPAPLIKPLLPPQQRWPSAQIAAWVESQTFSPAFLEFFARDPERTVPPGENFVSPADGRIGAIAFQNRLSYLVVGLSFWDVHVVRTPVAGTVRSVEEVGLVVPRNMSLPDVMNLEFLKEKTAPVQQIVTLDTAYGEVKVYLVTSYWASRIKVWVTPGQKLEKGERIGRILLGSTVVFNMPGQVQFTVGLQQRVVAGETIVFDKGAPK